MLGEQYRQYIVHANFDSILHCAKEIDGRESRGTKELVCTVGSTSTGVDRAGKDRTLWIQRVDSIECSHILTVQTIFSGSK